MLIGNGLKSFREDCGKLAGPGVNLEWEQYPGVKNRLCSTHPHNYYFEILTETGIFGLTTILIIASIFIAFVVKNFRFMKQKNYGNFILLAAIISLMLETLPLKSTGSLFTTHNGAYIAIIGSILLSYKKFLKN